MILYINSFPPLVVSIVPSESSEQVPKMAAVCEARGVAFDSKRSSKTKGNLLMGYVFGFIMFYGFS